MSNELGIKKENEFYAKRSVDMGSVHIEINITYSDKLAWSGCC